MDWDLEIKLSCRMSALLAEAAMKTAGVIQEGSKKLELQHNAACAHTPQSAKGYAGVAVLRVPRSPEPRKTFHIRRNRQAATVLRQQIVVTVAGTHTVIS